MCKTNHLGLDTLGKPFETSCCPVFTRYPLYRESALRKAKICRLVLGLLKFSVLVFVFFLSLFFTQSLRNYCSCGSQQYSLACINRNEFECEHVIRQSFIHPNMMLYAGFIYFSCTVLLALFTMNQPVQ